MYVLLSVESCYVLRHVMLHLVVSVMHEYSVLHINFSHFLLCMYMYMYVWCTSELPVSMKALKCKTLGAIIYRHHGIVINNVHVACACVNILN